MANLPWSENLKCLFSRPFSPSYPADEHAYFHGLFCLLLKKFLSCMQTSLGCVMCLDILSSFFSFLSPFFPPQICSSYIDPMFSGYFLQFHSMFSLYFGWWNLDIECNAHHYMYLVHQNKLMTFCGFGMKTTSFGPPSFRRQGALKKHNLYLHAIAPHHCLSPPTTTVIPVLKLNQIRPHNCSPRISSVSAETDSISRFGDILF